jgi:fumarate reductase subunit D
MYNKAIIAFITPMIVTFLIPLGLTGDSTVTELISAVVFSLSTAITVYLVPNKV